MSEKDYTKSNVFYDSYEQILETYAECNTEVWEDGAVLCLIDTPATVGLFELSDIIISYDKSTGSPMIITERVFRRNYSRCDWWKLRRHLKAKTSVIQQELGFNICISFSHDYIDYVHFKEEWWEWAKNHMQ